MQLVQADPEASRERSRATHEAWGGQLPVDTYVALETRLRGQPWAEEAMRVWLLCADGGEVLASCESYRMPSRIGPEPGHSYGIASVYTEPEKRRKGHAAALLAALGARLARTGQAMVLYSDVPLCIYQKVGFAPRPALHLAFTALPGDPGQGVDALVPETRAARVLDLIPPPPDSFAILPVPAQIDWHLERERIFAELLGRPRPPAQGARLGDAAILWSADHRDRQLTVLLLHAPERAQAEALVTCARRAAHAAGLARAVLWNPPRDFPLAGAQLEDRLERLDSVPMIRPLDPRLRAEDWNWIPRALWM